ncbi:MAG TPA: acireductone synthase [Pyrinomonadaceae bacterium]|nr:acireductone synthase [Pyrinomonadaceae bacterium]
MNDEVRGVLLDIEGTTTPIAFVHDVLFSYARDHVKQFLRENSDWEEVRADVELLRREHAEDVTGNPPPLDSTVESIAAFVEFLIGCDRKSTGLKSLQGKIWRQGYLDGSLKSQVFDDVAPAMKRWHEAGLNVSIFSSGSVLAQQLLFAHTNAGDLTGFIDNYFDTNVGKKADADSYRRIAADLGIDAREIVFISDVVGELEAAKQAGMKTLLSVRPGNAPLEPDQTFDRITGFTELTRFM